MLLDLWLLIKLDARSPMLRDALTLAFSTAYWLSVAALLTLVVNLAPGNGLYLPTERSLKAGSYGTEAFITLVGPKGGQILVDRTVDLIGQLWKEG